ncbi:MAG: 16S rRNA (guanine(527)-N(7))-methyltransferase RsmG [Rhizobiaceae bacterium]
MSVARIQRLREAGVDVSRETWADLDAFMALFSKWAGRINLAAPSTLEDLFERHVVDSAQILPLGGEALRWLDLGSGGGFPGAVLAILLKQRPGASIDLLESSHKKAAFLTTALGHARAPARVHAIRIEAAAGMKPEIVTARALAPLDELLGLSRPWLSSGARGLFHKGRDYRREIAESPRAAEYDLLAHASVVDAGSVILDVRRKPEGIRPAGPLLDRPLP